MNKLIVSVVFILSFLINAPVNAGNKLADILASQPEEVQARYKYRHPGETLEFIGIKPGMTVVEVLPGRSGWYSKILIPYLGEKGHLIGADYALDMFPKFGFFSAEALEAKKTWVSTWTTEATSWYETGAANISAFALGSMPDSMKGSADAVLLIRAMHNLSRFEGDGGYLTTAIQNVWDVLKPGGIVGVVQHEAPASNSDEWASGAAGYLKKSFVIERLTGAGFVLVDESDINANPLDKPTEDDIVWRLPPTYHTSKKIRS